MSLLISVQSELIKTRRTSSFWLCFIAAAFFPALSFFMFVIVSDDGPVKFLASDPWDRFFEMAWQPMCGFVFPMYVILLCALIVQIESRNNTWKQVYASPQKESSIYFSKFLVVQLFIFLFYIQYTLLMVLCGLVTGTLTKDYTFLQDSIDWGSIMQMNLKTYVSILSLSAFQYWLSLRFKSFIAPVGIGLALIIIGLMIASFFKSEHIAKFPYAYQLLSYDSFYSGGGKFIENHELNSLGYFLFFLIFGFLDMKRRKEKG